jgi:hypothetical protein
MCKHNYVFALLADDIEDIFRVSSQAGLWTYNRNLYGLIQPNTCHGTSQMKTNYQQHFEKGAKASMNFTGYVLSEKWHVANQPTISDYKSWDPLSRPDSAPIWCQGLHYRTIGDIKSDLVNWYFTWFNTICRIDSLATIEVVIASNSQHQIDLTEQFIKSSIMGKIPIIISKKLNPNDGYTNKLADDVLVNVNKYA